MAPETEELLEKKPGSDLNDGSMNPDAIRDQVIAELKTVFDPEIPVNIYELGLIYRVDVAADGATQVTMTLTTPMCPAAEELPPEAGRDFRAARPGLGSALVARNDVGRRQTRSRNELGA